jgi:hypothetical protein
MKWRFPENDEYPPLKEKVLVMFQSGDYEDREMTSHNETLKAWWKRNVERWLDESDESPELLTTPDEKALEKEAEFYYQDDARGDWRTYTVTEMKQRERFAYIEGRRRSIAREKEWREENLRYKEALYCIIGRIEAIDWAGMEEGETISVVKKYAHEAIKPPTTNTKQ